MDALLYYVNIYLVPAITVIVLYISASNKIRNFPGKRYFCAALVAVELGILSLIISWIPSTAPLGMLCMSVGGLACMLFIVLACYIWFIYVFSLIKQTDDLRPYKKHLLAAAIPMFAYFALILTSFWHGLLFSVTGYGEYVRGSAGWIPYVFALFYLVASSGMALSASKKEILKDRKQEYQHLTLLLLLPIIGISTQSIFYEYPATVPCTVLALLIIYFNIIKGSSSLDPLTGLSTRRQLNRYLSARFASSSKDSWRLIMIDMDGFKEINDVLGHTVGDKALVHMAKQLRHSFKERNAFVARYGGDEFVAVVSCKNDDDFIETIEKLSQNISEFNKRSDMPFILQYSLGFASFSKAVKSADDMLRIADEQMYRRKKAHKKAPISSVKEPQKI